MFNGEHDWESEYDDFVNSPDAGYTDHGTDRANDNSRNVGNAQDVVDNGEQFQDSETGTTVYVDGNKVVIIGDRGVVTQWKDQTASETSKNVESGKWIPK